jgi:anaerobic selenocysteine-containing dehydrogenase
MIEPPKGSRHDSQIMRDLAIGLVARREARTGKKAGLQARAKRELRLRTSPTVLIDLLLRRGPAKLSVRALKKSPNGVDLGPLEPQLPGRLKTKGKRIDLAQSMVLDDLARVRTELAVPAQDELLLIGRRHKRDCNSWMHNTERLTKGKARHQLLMHPADLDDRGIADGSVVQVTSRVGKVDVEVQATDDVMRGVVSLPHGFGHGAAGTRLSNSNDVAGVSINDLTDPEALDVTGNAALNGLPVTVTAS